MGFFSPSIKRVAILPSTAFFALIALTGCNTFQGAGQDISSVGRGIERTADGDHYSAYVTQRVYMRGGPGVNFPRVDSVRRGDSVDVHGCLSRRDWCDVSWNGRRGWVSANYINFRDGDRRLRLAEYDSRRSLNTVRFSYSYWDTNYTSRPWYKDRETWKRRYRYDD
jgi:uncharacterized protein YraI/predicted small secreted protein